MRHGIPFPAARARARASRARSGRRTHRTARDRSAPRPAVRDARPPHATVLTSVSPSLVELPVERPRLAGDLPHLARLLVSSIDAAQIRRPAVERLGAL